MSLGILLLGFFFPAQVPPSPPKPPAPPEVKSKFSLAGRVWAYFDTRDDGEAAKLLEEIRKEKPDCAGLENILRTGRTYEAAPAKLRKVEVIARDCDYKSLYWFRGPTKYSPEKRYPLLLICHGGGSVTDHQMQMCDYLARTHISEWRAFADRKEIFLAAPASDRNWGLIGHSLVWGAVADLCRKYPVDPDRIYLWGHSMGGNMAWRTSFHFCDHLAGAAPICCGYPFTKDVFEPLLHLPIYHLWGKQDSMLRDHGRKIEPLLREAGLTHVSKGKEGGHETYPDEFPAILDFFLKHKRDLYPERVIASTVFQPGTHCTKPTVAVTPEDLRGEDVITWQRGLSLTRYYWLEITALQDPARGGKLDASREKNTIQIRSTNVAKFRLYLHDKMLNLDIPVVVEVNGKKIFDRKVERDPAFLLSQARQYADAGRIYFAGVDLAVESPPAPPKSRGD